MLLPFANNGIYITDKLLKKKWNFGSYFSGKKYRAVGGNESGRVGWIGLFWWYGPQTIYSFLFTFYSFVFFLTSQYLIKNHSEFPNKKNRLIFDF